ncbi:hypothetical protein [Bradyrhizobium erythrophlei]|uniref:Uncharacterized protein n=1 Tax=Bradyrhizobium erythrophlei TaxID=1437360 RepID=A0A1M5NJP5_9BRAD|nr:hypothetical protein [Bradyrhizobium erythrophlei]SHG89677.1 hypothetical protein SAMN05443248_3020 [Bradyrhizobium erythrophlei]
MTTNPDTPRGPSVRLTEDILQNGGLTCIWLDRIAGQDQHTRLALRSTAVGRRSKGERIWFRSGREAEKVKTAILSRCFEAVRNRDSLYIKRPLDQVLELVGKTAFSLGITPISDADLAVTFDSINRRIDAAIARMQRDGSMKRINREYAELRKSGGTSGGTRDGTNGTSGTLPLPPYSEWLVGRLGNEISSCTDLVHLTRL